MTKSKIYFRADGNNIIGWGHVMRLYALADITSIKYETHFVIQDPITELKNRLEKVSKSIICLPQENNYEIESKYLISTILDPNSIIVLDGYNFNTQYQKKLKDAGHKVICIDDIHTQHFVADIVINHAGGVSKQDYSAESYTQFYLGLEYSILGEPFLKQAKKNVLKKANNNLFICLGGADPQNDTLQIVNQVLSENSEYNLNIVTGGSYNFLIELKEFISNNVTYSINLHNNLNEDEMLALMNLCSIAITSPSTISYEYLCTGGALYLKQTAENQNSIYNYFIESNLAFSIDNFPVFDYDRVEKAKALQKQHFDGNSSERLLKIFDGL